MEINWQPIKIQLGRKNSAPKQFQFASRNKLIAASESQPIVHLASDCNSDNFSDATEVDFSTSKTFAEISFELEIDFAVKF